MHGKTARFYLKHRIRIGDRLSLQANAPFSFRICNMFVSPNLGGEFTLIVMPDPRVPGDRHAWQTDPLFWCIAFDGAHVCYHSIHNR